MRILVNDFAGHAFQLQLSRTLARRGHSVLHTFFAGNNSPQGATELRDNDPSTLAIEPVGIPHRFAKHSVVTRRSCDIAYGREVSARVLDFRPDVVLSANMPLDAQNVLLSAARKTNASFVFWLQDLLSTAIEFVVRKKRLPLASWAGRFYAGMERRLLVESDAVVCIAPEFCERLRLWGIPRSKMFLIENWAPLDEVSVVPHANAWAKEQRIAGRFTFLYSGTLGMKHKPELLLQLAKHFEAEPNVVTVVVAEGAGMEWLRKHADVAPQSLRLIGLQPYRRIAEVLGAADVLITLLDAECGAFSVPSKTLAYLCAGRPQLVAAPRNNLAASVVSSAAAGIVVDPADVGSFVRAARRLFDDPSMRNIYAINARTYAECAFDIEEITDRFLDVFRTAVGAATTVPLAA